MGSQRAFAVALVSPLLGCHMLLPLQTVADGGLDDRGGEEVAALGDLARDLDGGAWEGDLLGSIDSAGHLPVSSNALGARWAGITVPCVMKDGTQTGQPIPIVDSAQPTFFAGSLASADPETVTWVGTLPWVHVVWDPNACEYEDWNSPDADGDWGSAGLLVRGATLVNGSLLLGAGADVHDINLVNASGTGAVKDEVAAPDDSLLATDYPQLAQPVAAAKQALVDLAAGN